MFVGRAAGGTRWGDDRGLVNGPIDAPRVRRLRDLGSCLPGPAAERRRINGPIDTPRARWLGDRGSCPVRGLGSTVVGGRRLLGEWTVLPGPAGIRMSRRRRGGDQRAIGGPGAFTVGGAAGRRGWRRRTGRRGWGHRAERRRVDGSVDAPLNVPGEDGRRWRQRRALIDRLSRRRPGTPPGLS